MSGYDKARDRAIEALKDYRFELGIWPKEPRTLNVEFSYPRVKENVNEMVIGLSDVRAADPIKITYDFDRDGYVVMQPYIIEKDMGDYIDASEQTWEEVGFFPAWALERKNVKLAEDSKDA